MSKLQEIRKRIKQIKTKVEPLFFRKIKCYKNLFNGNGSKNDAEIVLADLIKFSGANKTSFGRDLTSEQIALREAQKQSVLRILEFLKISDAEIKTLINNINKNNDKR